MIDTIQRCLKGYAALMRLCLSDALVEWGKASNDEDGRAVDAWLASNGVDLNAGGLGGTTAFTGKYIQVWGTAGKDERYVLFKPETVRQRAAQGNPLSRKFADEFCIRWRQYTAFIGQQMMRGQSFVNGWCVCAVYSIYLLTSHRLPGVVWCDRWAGHYSTLTRVSRRELVLIKRLKQQQIQMNQKAIALFVTIGITVGQFLLSFLAQRFFSSA